MSNELQINARLRLVKNNQILDSQLIQKLITVAGDGQLENVQTIGTTTSAIQLGNVTTTGAFLAVNLQSAGTDQINISQSTPAASAGALSILGPGECCLLRNPKGTLYALATAVGQKLGVFACDA